MIQEGKFSPSSRTFTPQQNSRSKEISRKELGPGKCRLQPDAKDEDAPNPKFPLVQRKFKPTASFQFKGVIQTTE
jgi:hypothetical protein